MSLHSSMMDLFAGETLKMLGWPSSTTNLIRMDSASINNSYPKDNQTDYVYFLTYPAESQINRQLIDDSTTTDANENTVRTIQECRTFRAEWQVYGANSSDNADKMRLALLTDQTIHDDLAAQGISIVPNIVEPVFTPESQGQQWYHRYDLFCDFNMLVVTTQTTGVITSANIEIISNKGVEETCSV